MTVNQNVVFFADAAEFADAVGEFIATEVAMGASVSELHEAYPDRVPSPIIVNRWRKRILAFDLLMEEAEEAKAERLADQVVGLADDDSRQAAQVNNAVKARQWLAGKLHRKYGEGLRKKEDEGMGGNLLLLTDEQLMRIAAQAVPNRGVLSAPEVVEGEAGEDAEVD